jgi:hypothetical protein
MIAKSRLIEVIVTVAAVLAMFVAVYTGYQTREQARCQARYNEVNNERTRILTDVGARERDAQRARDDALDATFLDPSLLKPATDRTPQERQRVQTLFAEYRKAAERLHVERVAADKARADNPVPEPPSVTCG